MRRIWGVAVSTAVLVAIAGCGNSSGGAAVSQSSSTSGVGSSSSSSQAAAPQSTSSTPSAESTGLSPALASKLAVSAQQLGSKWTGRTMAGGDLVQGQVTMDMCGAKFPSESLRTARHQVILSSASTGKKFSNEVVLYQPGGAQQARTELLKAIATCPSGPVEGPLQGEGMLTFKINPLSSNSHWLPGTVAVHALVKNSSGQSEDEVLIYQFRGDAMSAIYGSATNGQPDSSELQAAADAAALLQSSVPAAS